MCKKLKVMEYLKKIDIKIEMKTDYKLNNCNMMIGCPVPGVYGTNCSIPCPDVNCRYCHIETGACQGCKPGYQGHHCELGTAIMKTLKCE